jgi:hypothetical protein
MSYASDLPPESRTTAVETGYRAGRPSTRAAMPLWSPLQLLGLIVGIGFAVLGAVALAQTGFNTAHLDLPHQLVWSFPHSPLLGAIELAFGALMVVGSVVPGGARTLLGLLGGVALVFGIVVLATSLPNRLNDWLAVSHRNGWLYVITGAVVLAAAIFSPIVFTESRERRVVRSTTEEY